MTPITHSKCFFDKCSKSIHSHTQGKKGIGLTDTIERLHSQVHFLQHLNTNTIHGHSVLALIGYEILLKSNMWLSVNCVITAPSC